MFSKSNLAPFHLFAQLERLTIRCPAAFILGEQFITGASHEHNQDKATQKIAGRAGAEGREITTDDLLLAAHEVTPMSTLMAGRLEKLQHEAKSGQMMFAHGREPAE